MTEPRKEYSELRMQLNQAHLEIIKKREYRGAREADVVKWLADYVGANFISKHDHGTRIRELEIKSQGHFEQYQHYYQVYKNAQSKLTAALAEVERNKEVFLVNIKDVTDENAKLKVEKGELQSELNEALTLNDLQESQIAGLISKIDATLVERGELEADVEKWKTIAEIYETAAKGSLRPIKALNAFAALMPEQKKLILAMSEAMLAVKRNGDAALEAMSGGGDE